MALQGTKIDGSRLSCSICLDIMEDPVTIPCGHSYCMKCIKRHWDEEDLKKIHSCPQCRKTFIPRPPLMKSTMLADLVEGLKETGIKATPAVHYAGPGDVACDICSGKKQKAVKSCLDCLVSYCQQHLQPHYDVEALKKHRLVNPFDKLQEIICARHNEVMKIFCRTDQKCICYLCSVEEHADHKTVPASAERTERQKELKMHCKKIQRSIQNREKAVKVLQREVDAINHSADEAVSDSEKIFSELILLIERRSTDIKRQIRSKQETEVNRAKELLEKVEEELNGLQRENAELEKLSLTEDHTLFLHMFPSLSDVPEPTEVPCPKSLPLLYFEDVAAAVSEVKDKLQSVLCEECENVSHRVAKADVLLPHPEPKTRADFLQCSSQLTLDPNTVNTRFVLSEEDRRVKHVIKKQSYPSHPERFMKKCQVLSRESLTGRHYWEVEWSGSGIYIAVAYKSITRTADDSEFGNNDKSWALRCSSGQYEFSHNKICQWFSGPRSSKIGVYLDHREGILSFYGVSETVTLLHRVQTTFTEPLYAGLRAYHFLNADSSAVFCALETEETTNE